METITIKKAKIIWKILKKHIRLIHGTVETATHQNYDNKKIWPPEYSKMGKLLISNSWLPDKNGDYDKPSNLFLSDLHDEFDIEGANKIEEKLGFKTQARLELLKQLPQEEQEIYNIVSNAVQKGLNKQEIINFIKMKIEQPQIVEVTESREEIGSTFINSITPTSSSSSETFDTQSSGWNGPTPGIEDASETEYEVIFPDEKGNLQLEVRHKGTKESEIKSKSGRHINGKEFLKEQYDGRCQICNTRLDLGNGNPFFYLTHIAEVKHERAWGDMVWNILCLCPNCHALIKHGRNNDLSDIQQIATLASEHEIALSR